MEVADVVRKHQAVLDYFNHPKDESFFDDIAKLDGGLEVNHAIKAYLDKFGIRCTGDIDITQPRWCEKPTALIPILVNNISNFEPDARKSKVRAR